MVEQKQPHPEPLPARDRIDKLTTEITRWCSENIKTSKKEKYDFSKHSKAYGLCKRYMKKVLQVS